MTHTTSQSSGPVHFVSPLHLAHAVKRSFRRPTMRRPRSSSPQDSAAAHSRTLSATVPTRHSPRPYAYRHSASATARATPALHLSRPVRYPRAPELSTQAHGLSRTFAVRCYGRAWPVDSSCSGRPQGGGASSLHHLRPLAPRPVA